MATRAGIKTAEVMVFLRRYLAGNPTRGAKSAAAEHFEVSQAAISYHIRKMRAIQFKLEPMRCPMKVEGQFSQDDPQNANHDH